MNKHVQASPSKSTHYLTLFLLTILFSGIAIVLYQWVDKRDYISDVKQSLIKRQGDPNIFSDYSYRRSAALESKKIEIAQRLNDLEEKLRATDKQHDNSSDLKILSAVEGMIVTADRNLRIKADTHSALDLLKYSQELLQSSNTDDFSKLNRALVKHIKLLEKQEEVDISLINQHITKLGAQIDNLPLNVTDKLLIIDLPQAENTSESSTWYRYFLEIRQDIRQLMKIEKIDDTQVSPLSPLQIGLLRENIKLQLLQARLALLTRDKINFNFAIKTVKDWLQQYFNTEDLVVRDMLVDLKRYLNTEIELQLPYLERTLEIVHHNQLMLEERR